MYSLQVFYHLTDVRFKSIFYILWDEMNLYMSTYCFTSSRSPYNWVYLLLINIRTFINYMKLYIWSCIFVSDVTLSHLIPVDCDPSTSMLMLSSFQRSYCTLPALLESMWEVILLLRGLSAAWNHCSLTAALLSRDTSTLCSDTLRMEGCLHVIKCLQR